MVSGHCFIRPTRSRPPVDLAEGYEYFCTSPFIAGCRNDITSGWDQEVRVGSGEPSRGLLWAPAFYEEYSQKQIYLQHGELCSSVGIVVSMTECIQKVVHSRYGQSLGAACWLILGPGGSHSLGHVTKLGLHLPVCFHPPAASTSKPATMYIVRDATGPINK